VRGAERDIDRRLDRLERRLVAGIKRQLADMTRDVATARAALYPKRKPQERVLNAIPLLARHGPALFDAILERASDHARALCGLRLDRAAHAAPTPPGVDVPLARSVRRD
jgi:hypothetical protein